MDFQMFTVLHCFVMHFLVCTSLGRSGSVSLGLHFGVEL